MTHAMTSAMTAALPTRADLESAAEIVHAAMPPSAQHCWPLLSERAGCEVWVKHENHNPTGAFKIRGGHVYMADLRQSTPETAGVIAATRGNHGQSIATAACAQGLTPVIVVPEGNSTEKNAAMRAQGAELVEHGHDFQAALEHAIGLADERKLHMVQSFHPLLVRGVGTYALELFTAVPDLDAVYVPIGLGSGICGVMAARDAVGSTADVIGVVAENAPAYALSFKSGNPVSTNAADTFADGMACRVPVPDAVTLINKGTARIVEVTEDEIAAAMGHYYTDTHNLAEGAGAASLAALLQEKDRMAGKCVGVILTGGNIDRDLYLEKIGAT